MSTSRIRVGLRLTLALTSLLLTMRAAWADDIPGRRLAGVTGKREVLGHPPSSVYEACN